jgi:FAD/FMN-containing dehydrogenase
MDAVAELIAALPPGTVLTGAEIGDRHKSDESRTGRSLPKAVVRPASTAEVATALAICDRHRQPVVPQGGLTGLAGGANAGEDEVALSLERLAGVEALDADAATITLRAGTVLEVAQGAAAAAGFLLPVDLGARGSCQIGGMLANNAGGIRVLRYGMTRENVLGLEAVLADGTVLGGVSAMPKNNTGYDLKQLFIGSEGTLGVITRAVLRLHPAPAERLTALCALGDYAAVLELLQRARSGLAGLSAFEAMWRDYFATCSGDRRLFEGVPTLAVIVECDSDGGAEDRERFEALLGAALEDGVIGDALIAQSEKEARDFWEVREGIALDHLMGLINFDVSLPVGDLGRFAEACGADLEARFPTARVLFFGHVADGNLHIVVAPPEAEATHAIEDAVYDLVRDFAGSISAEHGIGVLKRPWLGNSRTEAELTTMRRLKLALDPNAILNPGKILPAGP